MENDTRDAIADLRAETQILRTGFSSLVHVLARSGFLDEKDLGFLADLMSESIENAAFRDEARKDAERDIHAEWRAGVIASYRAGEEDRSRD